MLGVGHFRRPFNENKSGPPVQSHGSGRSGLHLILLRAMTRASLVMGVARRRAILAGFHDAARKTSCIRKSQRDGKQD